MAFNVKDRVWQYTDTEGTGTYTLGATKPGYQSFAAVGDGNPTYYCVTDGEDWEIVRGVYTASGTTLSRASVRASSNGNAAVDWGPGTKDVFAVDPASESFWNLAAGLITTDGNGTLSVTAKGTADGNVPAFASGGLDLGEKELLRAVIKDIAEKTQTINHSSSGALAIDYEAGACVIVNQSANITSMSVSNLPPSGAVALLLEFRKDNNGTERTVVWISGFTTPGGAAITKTQTANAVDRYLLSAQDASSPVWRVDTLGNDYKAP